MASYIGVSAISKYFDNADYGSLQEARQLYQETGKPGELANKESGFEKNLQKSLIQARESNISGKVIILSRLYGMKISENISQREHDLRCQTPLFQNKPDCDKGIKFYSEQISDEIAKFDPKDPNIPAALGTPRASETN
jgi:hypothetical protein